MAYEFLYRLGYRNMRVLEEGIPGWFRDGYPVEGKRVGAVEDHPYSPAAWEFERLLKTRDSNNRHTNRTTTPTRGEAP